MYISRSIVNQNSIQKDSLLESKQNAVDYREIYPAKLKYNKFSKLPSDMEKLPFDYSQFVNKPFLVANIPWASSRIPGYVLGTISIPGSIMSTNAFLAIPWRSSCFYRMRGRAIVQVAGTINHSGVAIVYTVPANASDTNINNALLVPHSFLYANQASPVAVEIPFYNNLPLRQTCNSDVCRSNQYNDAYDSFAAVKIAVLSQLKTAVVSPTVNVSVHIIIDELEFYTPKPLDVVYSEMDVLQPQAFVTQFFDGLASILKKGTADAIDSSRGALRQWTGLHNPNLPAPTDKSYMQMRTNPNIIDGVSQHDLLGPYAMADSRTDDHYFQTTEDEMDISYLLRQPQYLTTALVKDSDAAETLLFSRPITPFMPAAQGAGDYRISTIQAKLAACATHWSGDMELMIQSSMTNLQFVKLLVVLDYSRNFNSTNIGTNTYPSLGPYQGTITHTLEFSGGGTIKCIKLPFMSPFRQLPVTTDWRTNSLQHGVVRVYLLQPIVNGTAVATNADFLFYVRGTPTLTLHGFATRRFNTTSAATTAVMFKVGDEEEEETPDQLRPQSEISTVAVQADQQCIDVQDEMSFDSDVKAGVLRPLKSVRDIARRMYPVFAGSVSQATLQANSSASYSLNISLHLLWRSYFSASAANAFSPLDVVSDLFWGFRGGLKAKIVTYGTNSVNARYLPPSIANFSSTGTAIPSLVPTGPSTTNAAFLTEFAAATNQFAQGKPQLQLPVQEAPNYARRAENRFSTTPGTSYNADSINITDVEIPYMSAYDFTTNSSIYNTANANFFSPEENLGSIILNFVPTNVGPSPATSAIYSPINYVIYLGIADDARFGFLVGGDAYNPAYVSDSGTLIQIDPYLPNGEGTGATNVTVPLLITTAGADKNYYTKTA